VLFVNAFLQATSPPVCIASITKILCAKSVQDLLAVSLVSIKEIAMQLDLEIHNFYEHLLVEYLVYNKFTEKYDQEFLADISCLALTQLPARYIRHDIDMAFFLEREEREEMNINVAEAIDSAVSFLKNK